MWLTTDEVLLQVNKIRSSAEEAVVWGEYFDVLLCSVYKLFSFEYLLVTDFQIINQVTISFLSTPDSSHEYCKIKTKQNYSFPKVKFIENHWEEERGGGEKGKWQYQLDSV